MHPRNPYRTPPDFSALAESFTPLKKFVSISDLGKPSINFQDEDAQRALTQALLQRDFNITLSLPENRLCPTVPNRLNYILWLQDILSPFNNIETHQAIRGLDIGTGASAIYPILACSLSPTTREWSFVATEIDPLSARFASQNVEVNNLSSRIKIWPITRSSSATADPGESLSPILAPLVESESLFDFTMCNPPFYGSKAEIETSAQNKELPPNAVCTGADTEMITPGGEAAFVLQMVHESVREDVRRRCRWFTSMLGKISSVGTVVEELRNLEIHNYALTQFVQGTTRRWAIGWSHGEDHLPDAIARPTSSSLTQYLPAPTTLRQTFVIPRTRDSLNRDARTSLDAIRSAVSKVLASINGLTFHEFDNAEHGAAWRYDVEAMENTWSRAARRKRKRSRSPSVGRIEKAPRLEFASTATQNFPQVLNSNNAPRPALQCQIKALDTYPGKQSQRDSEISPSVTLEVQWVRGSDRTLFEGFWSHVCRKVKDIFV